MRRRSSPRFIFAGAAASRYGMVSVTGPENPAYLTQQPTAKPPQAAPGDRGIGKATGLPHQVVGERVEKEQDFIAGFSPVAVVAKLPLRRARRPSGKIVRHIVLPSG